MVIIRTGLILMVLLCALSDGAEPTPHSMTIPSEDSQLTTVPASIIDAALAEEDLNVLVAAIRSAEPVNLLSSQSPLTIFAPTDKAFAKISQSDLEDILRTNQTLKSVLTCHLVGGNLSSADFKNGIKVTSEEVGALTFNISSNV